MGRYVIGGLIGAARRGLSALQPAVPTSDRGVLILAYHLVGAGTRSPVDLPDATFRRQIDEIRRLARPLSLDDALDEISEAAEPSEGRPAVVVTFDDAYRNFFERAVPVLEEAAVPATLFVPTGFIDGEIGSPIRHTEDLPPATWDDLGRAAEGGLISIGSHGIAHHNLVSASADVVRSEIEGSAEILRRRLGGRITSFCYPEGFAPRRARRLVRDTYRCGLASGGVRVVPGRGDWTALPRLPIRRDQLETLEPVLDARIWLAEAVASRVRRARAEAHRFKTLWDRGE